MNERLARGAARVLELDEEPVRQGDDHRPDTERDGEGEQRAEHRLTPTRPGELYKAGMFSLLAAVQLAWLIAIGYGIFILVH
jgi:hypothetical protein